MDSANDYILLQLDLLLDELVMQQFVLGVDTHLRVARFVAKNHGRNFSDEEWKYRLAALLCHSEEDQKIFYETFDNFIKKQKQASTDLETAVKEDKPLEKQVKIEEKQTESSQILTKQQTAEHKAKPAKTVGRSGPIRIELRFPQNDLRIWNTSEIDKAVRPLLEKEWSYVSDWDIPLSIKATIRNGGMPTFHRRRRKTTPQYILLIEQKNPRDHLAGLYADLGAELRRRDVAVEWFFYDHIPYRCWRDRREPSSFTNVDRLAAEYDGSKLLIIGEPNGLLALPDLRPSNRTLDLVDNFKEVALLCNKSTAQWTNAELALCQLFPVVPATAAGLATLVAQWDAPSVWTPDFWKTVHQEVSVPSVEAVTSEDEDDFDEMMDNLRFYLGKTGYAWLCAAAVYPDIYYELTTLLNDESIVPDASLTEWAQNTVWFTALLRLSRLRWFRDGAIPNRVRERLRGKLPPEQAKEVRRQLLEVLDLDSNQPPPNSYAAANQTFTMAWYSHEQQVLDPSVSDAERAHLETEFYQNNTNVQLSDIADAIGQTFFNNIQPTVQQTENIENQSHTQESSHKEVSFDFPQSPTEADKFYVLWVDDIPRNNESSVNRLKTQHQNIIFELAYSTDDAIDKIQKNYFDVIISDLGRPEGREAGIDLWQILKTNNCYKPYALFTANAERTKANEKILDSGISFSTDVEVEIENWVSEKLFEKFPKKEEKQPVNTNIQKLIEEIRKLVANAKTEEAINVFIKWAETNDTDLNNSLLLLKTRLNTLKRNENLGLIVFSDASRERAQISNALLQMLEELDKTRPSSTQPKNNNQGHFLLNIPKVIPLGKEQRCICRIAYDDETLVRDFKKDENTIIQSIRIAEVMGVDLVEYSDTPAFSIRKITEEEQFISTDDYTQWTFMINPLRLGQHPLTIKVTVIEEVSGKERNQDIVLENEITVVEAEETTSQQFEDTDIKVNYTSRKTKK